MKITYAKPICLIFTMILLTTVGATVSAEEKQPALEKAAVINGTIITKNEYNRELNLYIDRITRQGRQINDSQLANLKTEILDSLINRELLYQQSQKTGVVVQPQEMMNEVTAIKQRFPSEDEFNKAISNMDLTEATLKVRITQRLAIQKFIDKQIADKIVVSTDESKQYYNANPQLFKQSGEVRASHILIKVDPAADDAKKAEAQTKIKMIQQKLRNGENFAELAKTSSEGPSSVNGGDLGFFKRGQMVKPFEDAAFALEPNEVSKIIQTRFGYHIIKVVEKKPERKISYEEIKKRLDEHLKQRKVQEEVGLYLIELRKTAKIEKLI
jgi:peptidyl-prolyl cis-trans isomerase C